MRAIRNNQTWVVIVVIVVAVIAVFLIGCGTTPTPTPKPTPTPTQSPSPTPDPEQYLAQINLMLRHECPGFRFDDAMEWLDEGFYRFSKSDGLLLLPEEEWPADDPFVELGFGPPDLSVIYTGLGILCNFDTELALMPLAEAIETLYSECMPYLVQRSVGFYTVKRAYDDADEAVEQFTAENMTHDDLYIRLRQSYHTMERICSL